MKYTVVNECNVVQYYEQEIDANSEEEAIEIAEEEWNWDLKSENCEDSRTYIGR